MNFEELLKDFNCKCGKTHTCAIEHVIVEEGAISKLAGLIGSYSNILLIADCNTYKACGDAVKAQVGDKCENLLVFECEGFLVPNEDAIAKAQEYLTEKTDLIIGIGSGVIQDLCKYVSFEAKLPYYIVATAPSMYGYASVGAAMIICNM